NGGQCGSGFNIDQQTLEERLGHNAAHALWALAEDAKAEVKRLCTAHAPEAHWRDGVADGVWTARGADEAARYADHLRKHYHYDAIEPLDRTAFQALVKSPSYQGGTLDRGAGHLHPLRYAHGLARAAEAAGATIHERTEATAVAPGSVTTLHGTLSADHVILAGNGYLPNLHPAYAARVMPINSFIAATEPLNDPKAVLAEDIAVADDKFVVNYFRLSEDNRLLFGGRENYGIGFPADILTKLRHRMIRLFPQLQGTKIDYHWGGTLGITMSRVPLVQQLAPGLYAAGGFSGHGVALTAIAGRVMAEAIAGDAARLDTLSLLPTPRFPGGAAARAPLLTLAMTWYALRDRLGI
ncbi:MAG: NAD(P)/FAD-dependent oxidoreductase, partial [Shimia sp.]